MAIDDNGFRIREYRANDWVHRNLEYGELVLQQIESVLSSIAEN
jgi:hypothetical protein